MQPAAAHAGHKHFNFQAAARHVTYDGKTARIEYVDTANRTVVSVPPAEYETTGFDGSWDNAYYVTPPSQLKRLAVAKRGDVPGTRWYEQAVDTPGARGVNRILWSETLQAPLSVEYRSADGRVVRKLTLTPAPAAARDVAVAGARQLYAQGIRGLSRLIDDVDRLYAGLAVRPAGIVKRYGRAPADFSSSPGDPAATADDALEARAVRYAR